MLIEISSPQSSVVFHQEIESIEQDGFNVYCSAHAIWGEMNWQTLEIKHKGEVIDRMINSSTMMPTIVGGSDAE
jgi:hypothetical protein